MEIPACVVGRLDPGGAWIGFAPILDDGYALTVATDGRHDRSPAQPLDLIALAVLYFEDSVDAPPEEMAATHGDIGAIVRHAADRVGQPARVAASEAVDAIDDGLAADVVIERLQRVMGDGVDAIAHLRRRVAALRDVSP
ncbi:MAG TPA: hypothetical protein VFP30_01130 [Candidatus Limnocylindria bacterium]|nr:hypothetical protein [Candidatus Limnocylindria bacterium]